MFNFIIKWKILFLLFQSTNQISFNKTFHLSFGFFCIYCGQPSLIESKKIIDCSSPYHIYCSYNEAIGCVKYIKTVDYRIDIIKDCLRSTDHSLCKPEYPLTNVNITEKTFCCNNTHFCNRISSIFYFSKQQLFIHLFIIMIKFCFNISEQNLL